MQIRSLVSICSVQMNRDREDECQCRCCAAADAEVTIEGPAKADIVKKEVHNGVLTIDYLPVIPGEYMVNVKSHGKHIHGSPFSARISGVTVVRIKNICSQFVCF